VHRGRQKGTRVPGSATTDDTLMGVLSDGGGRSRASWRSPPCFTGMNAGGRSMAVQKTDADYVAAILRMGDAAERTTDGPLQPRSYRGDSRGVGRTGRSRRREADPSCTIEIGSATLSATSPCFGLSSPVREHRILARQVLGTSGRPPPSCASGGRQRPEGQRLPNRPVELLDRFLRGEPSLSRSDHDGLSWPVRHGWAQRASSHEVEARCPTVSGRVPLRLFSGVRGVVT
jgi:hypothetical protein